MTSALFVIFTYLGPLLHKLVDAGPRTIGTFFALFGVAGFVGNLLATRVVTRLGTFATSAAVILSMFLGALVWSLGVGVLAAMAVGILLQGFGFAAANSMQQARLVAAAPELSSATVALNTSSIYVGQALGSALGGFLFEHEHLVAVGYATAAFFGAALAVLALTRRRAGSLAGKA
jgi:predicted MFS family arabinose efflux permease